MEHQSGRHSGRGGGRGESYKGRGGGRGERYKGRGRHERGGRDSGRGRHGRGGRFVSSGINNDTNAMQTVYRAQNKKLTQTKDVNETISYIQENMTNFDYVNNSTALNQLCKNKKSYHLLFKSKPFNIFIERNIIASIDNLPYVARELANITYNLAKLNHRKLTTAYFAKINNKHNSNVLKQILQHGNPQEIANTLW